MSKSPLRKIIRVFLEVNPELRDDVAKTIRYVHLYQLGVRDFTLKNIKKVIKEFTLYDFYKAEGKGLLSASYSIDREWRRVQQKDILLRGKCWDERQKSASKMAQSNSTKDVYYN